MRLPLQGPTQSHPLHCSHPISSYIHFLVGLHVTLSLCLLGTFAHAVPSAWNAFPCRQFPSSLLHSGRSHLKCHTLRITFPDQLISHSSLHHLYLFMWLYVSLWPLSPADTSHSHSFLHCWLPRLECKLCLLPPVSPGPRTISSINYFAV